MQRRPRHGPRRIRAPPGVSSAGRTNDLRLPSVARRTGRDRENSYDLDQYADIQQAIPANRALNAVSVCKTGQRNGGAEMKTPGDQPGRTCGVRDLAREPAQSR